MKLKILAFFTLLILFIPLTQVLAGSVSDLAECSGATDCGLCNLVKLINGVSWYLIKVIMIPFAAISIFIAGFVLMTANGNVQKVQQAKSILRYILLGILIALAAFLVTDALFKLLLDDAQFGNWNEVSCVVPFVPVVPVVPVVGGGGGGGGGTVACEDITTAQTSLNAGGTVCTPDASCASCDTSTWDASISNYSTLYGVPEEVIRTILARESSCGLDPATYDMALSADGLSCGLMQVVGMTDCYDDDESIKQGTIILAAAYASASSMIGPYGTTVTLDELAAAIYNAGVVQSTASADCTPLTGWPTIPKWGCPINPGTATYNACYIRDYACDVGACLN